MKTVLNIYNIVTILWILFVLQQKKCYNIIAISRIFFNTLYIYAQYCIYTN